MSLNRYEQDLFDYIERHPEEHRHWVAKVVEATRGVSDPGDVARVLEREVWAYFQERCEQVPQLRVHRLGGGQRVSMLNLTELMLRLWGPLPKPKKSARPAE